MGSGIKIKRAIKKYGIENFKREILFECKNAEEMAAKEAELVTPEFLKRPDVYNLAKGGYLGWIRAHEKLSSKQFKKWGKIGGTKFKESLKNKDYYKQWHDNLIEKVNSPEAIKKRAARSPTFLR